MCIQASIPEGEPKSIFRNVKPKWKDKGEGIESKYAPEPNVREYTEHWINPTIAYVWIYEVDPRDHTAQQETWICVDCSGITWCICGLMSRRTVSTVQKACLSLFHVVSGTW